MKMGIWCIDSRGNEVLLKSTMGNEMIPYHYIGYCNPIPDSYFTQLSYSEIIEELWKFPEQKENQMKHHVIEHYRHGWYISPVKKIDGEYYYLWKDLKLHRGSTGWDNDKHKTIGSAPGYYKTKFQAKLTLGMFKEKQKMTDQIEINVRVNGIETPLHKISEQTLLTVRENSKPEEVPVARVANLYDKRRLVLRVPENIGRYKGRVVAIDLKCGKIVNYWYPEIDCGYMSCYKNTQTIV